MKLSTLNKGLVGHWMLDQSSLKSSVLFADKTPYNNDGVSANTPNFVADRMGQADRAMSFDGESDYVDVPDISQHFSTIKGTIFVWCNVNFLKTQGVVTFQSFRPLIYFQCGNTVQVHWGSATGMAVADSYTSIYSLPAINTWFLITFVWDNSTGQYWLYLNDELKEVDSGCVFPSTPAGNTHFGEYSGNHFNGDIADVRIYNRAISQEEVTMLYEQYRPKLSVGSLKKGLVLDMPLNTKRYNAGNSKFDDLTPYENRGTNNGGDVDTDHTTFNGSSDYVRIPDSENLSPTSAMTAMVWVKGAPNEYLPVFAHADIVNNQFAFHIQTAYGAHAGETRLTLSDNGVWETGHQKDWLSNTIAFDNTWHLVGFTFNAGTLKMYTDGVEDTNPTKTHNDPITTIHNSTTDVTIGCYLDNDTPTGFFDGDISGAKIWNRALGAEEIKLLFEKSKGMFL